MARLGWFGDVLIALAIAAAALAVVQIFNIASTGGTWTRGFWAWWAQIREPRAIAFTVLGIASMMATPWIRSRF